MSVFDGQIQTPLRVDDPLTDRNMPPAGKLSWTAKSKTALAGCTGIDAKLVHGDRWQQLERPPLRGARRSLGSARHHVGWQYLQVRP